MKTKILKKTAAGFTLVEVMVGMVIGMLGLLIIMQIFSFVEGQKRTTTGAGDAQTTGITAMYSLQRDVRLAGYGFSALNIFACPVNIYVKDDPYLIKNLVPVTINPPVLKAVDPAINDPNTDILLIAYGTANGAAEGEIIFGVNNESKRLMMPSLPENITAETYRATYSKNNWVIAAPGKDVQFSDVDQGGCLSNSRGPLKMVQVDSVLPNDQNIELSRSSGVSDEDYPLLFNLGASPKVLVYAVRKGNLTVCDYLKNNCAESPTKDDYWEPVADNIVSLRAEYGVQAGGAVRWSQDDLGANNAPAAFGCNWVSAPALRVALVARNAQTEKDLVTPTVPVWEGNNSPTPVPINLEKTCTGDKCWQYFRYKVFQTAIPIRNMPWVALCS